MSRWFYYSGSAKHGLWRVAVGNLAFAWKTPRYQPLYSERNRIGCIVLGQRFGYRLTITWRPV